MRVFNFWLNDLAFVGGVGFLAGIASADVGFSLIRVFLCAGLVYVGACILFPHFRTEKILAIGLGFFFIGRVYFNAYPSVNYSAPLWLEDLMNLKLLALKLFGRFLPSDEAGLLGGIAFGSKASLSVGLKRDLSLAGVTHLVAVSGYNITIVLYSVEKALGRFLARRAVLICAAFATVLFVVMTGLEPSAVRAAIMGFIAVVAIEMGGKLDVRNALVLTAVAMTLFDVTLPVHGIGFQLSFLSLAGIIYLKEPLQNFLHIDGPGFFSWKENAITTLSAQLAVVPILSAVFGGFSITAIGANILILGFVPVTMFFGALLLGIGVISQYAAFLLAGIVHVLLAYQIAVIHLFAALAVPLPIPFGVWPVAIIYYILLFWVANI